MALADVTPAPTKAPQLAAGYAILGMLLVLLWQWATVHASYGGNWSALFCTGSIRGVPPSLAGEHIYQFQGSTGYDGQIYHYIAHDPLFRSAELWSFVDAPRLRYRRILVPALAWILALGQSEWVDWAYRVECLLWIGLGVFWSAELCVSFGRPAAWGLAFLVLPATLVTVDRMLVDGALATLSAGFVLYVKRGSWHLWVILALAALTRETGVLLLAGYCGHLLLRRQWGPMLRFSLAALPAALWFAYVDAHTTAIHIATNPIPLGSIALAIFHPAPYPPNMPLVPILVAADELAIAAAIFAFSMVVFLVFVRRCRQPECLAALGFVLTGIAMQLDDHWSHVFHYSRVYTPVLIVLALQGLSQRSAIWFLPWLAMLPRIGMQLAPQILHVLGR